MPASLRLGFSRSHLRRPLLLMALGIPLNVTAIAQNVGIGEQPFNAAIYKGSHNSETRTESLAEQIDDYNVWQLELDVYDYDGQLKIAGDTCDPLDLTRADSLDTLMSKLQSDSDPALHPFTLIYLDMKGMGQDGCAYSWGSQLNDRMKTVFTQELGEGTIYPSSVFVNQDGSSWPSYQNLTTRGYRWAIVVDWHGMTPPGADLDKLFFEATSTNPTDNSVDAALSPSTVLVNIEGGCDIDPTSTSPGIRNNRWIYRAWPSGNCSTACALMSNLYWGNAVERKYSFVATNCINYANTFLSPTHSPDPVFVDQRNDVSCPIASLSVCEGGTKAYPFHNLNTAVDRASAMVSLLLASGDYTVTAPGRPRVFNSPIRFKSATGSVATIH
jgi:hypothetical protein